MTRTRRGQSAIGKEAWEKAKQRRSFSGAKLRSLTPCGKRVKRAEGTEKKSHGKDGLQKPEPLKCRFHDLRHRAVTRLLEAGVPYPVVASMMGWSAATAIAWQSVTGQSEAMHSNMRQ